MLHYQKNVGRLVEIRMRGSSAADDIAALRKGMIENLRKLGPDEKVVAVTDLRGAKAVTAAVAEDIATLLRATNTRLERAALIIDDPVTWMQSQRVLEAAKSDARKVFKTAAEAEAFLSPVLSPEERERLKKFLSEG